MPTKTKSCPCKEETPDQLKFTSGAKPRRVITMVHGTFAKHANWTHKGKLCKALESMSGTMLFSRFCWSGKNSHTARLSAGDDLAAHLKALLEKFGDADHFVIGHSHGGNVAMYAMEEINRDDKLDKEITGLVTLATPFLTLRRRQLHQLIRISVFLLALFAIVGAIIIPLEEDPQFAFFLKILLLIFIIWLVPMLISVLLYRGRKFGIPSIFKVLVRHSKAETILSKELKRLRLTPFHSVRSDERTNVSKQKARRIQLNKMLVIRTLGDEASMGLMVSQFLSWTNNRILTLLASFVISFRRVGRFSWIWKILLFFLLGLLSFLFLAEYSSFGAEWLLELNPVYGDFFKSIVIYVIVGNITLVIIYGLVSLISLIALQFAAGPAFGFDAMFWNLFASTTAEACPPGPARIYLHAHTKDESGSAKADLAHSKVYSSNSVIQEIVDWIEAHAASIEPSQG